jgi:hypothetical protein
MDGMYSVRQSMSIVLFDIDSVLNDVDVALNISSVWNWEKKWNNKVTSPEIDGFVFYIIHFTCQW